MGENGYEQMACANTTRSDASHVFVAFKDTKHRWKQEVGSSLSISKGNICLSVEEFHTGWFFDRVLLLKSTFACEHNVRAGLARQANRRNTKNPLLLTLNHRHRLHHQISVCSGPWLWLPTWEEFIEYICRQRFKACNGISTLTGPGITKKLCVLCLTELLMLSATQGVWTATTHV